MPEEREPNPRDFVRNEVLDLKLKNVVSQMTTRMVVIGAMSAGLTQIQVPAEITVGAIVAAAVVPIGKACLAIVGGR